MSPSSTDSTQTKTDLNVVKVVIRDTDLSYYENGDDRVVSPSPYKIGEKFFRATAKDSGLLPAVTRWVNEDFTNFIVERPPFQAHIFVTDIDDEDLMSEFNINVPWTVWGLETHTHGGYIEVSSAYVFARNSMLTSLNDPLFSLPMPNLYSEGKVCFGDNHASLPSTHGPSAVIMHAINLFWTDYFNNDLTDNLVYTRLPKGFGFNQDDHWDGSHESMCDVFSTWEKLSMEDVLDMQFSLVDGEHYSFQHLVHRLSKPTGPYTANMLAKFFKEIMS